MCNSRNIVYKGALIMVLPKLYCVSHFLSTQDALLERAQTWSAAAQRMEHILICCVCLGDNSEDADEIIQCDNCGVTVHEGKRSVAFSYFTSTVSTGQKHSCSEGLGLS